MIECNVLWMFTGVSHGFEDIGSIIVDSTVGRITLVIQNIRVLVTTEVSGGSSLRESLVFPERWLTNKNMHTTNCDSVPSQTGASYPWIWTEKGPSAVLPVLRST